MFRPISFKEWIRRYEREYKRELNEWQTVNHSDGIIPQGLDESLLQQYVAYTTQIQTRKLIIATWFLAIFTIILSLISLFIKK